MSAAVAIVGGGPVGLMLALFLDYYGVKSVLFNTDFLTRTQIIKKRGVKWVQGEREKEAYEVNFINTAVHHSFLPFSTTKGQVCYLFRDV